MNKKTLIIVISIIIIIGGLIVSYLSSNNVKTKLVSNTPQPGSGGWHDMFLTWNTSQPFKCNYNGLPDNPNALEIPLWIVNIGPNDLQNVVAILQQPLPEGFVLSPNDTYEKDLGTIDDRTRDNNWKEANWIVLKTIATPWNNLPPKEFSVRVEATRPNGTSIVREQSLIYTFGSSTGFSDVVCNNQNQPYANLVKRLVESGIASGCSAGKFCPTANVTRAQMAKFLLASMEQVDPATTDFPLEPCQGLFADVPASNPFCSYIEKLYKMNIVSGCSNNPLKFCPDNSLTRGQMSKYIAGGMAPFVCPDNPNPNICYGGWQPGEQIFCDVPEGGGQPDYSECSGSKHTFYEWIQRYFKFKITDGCYWKDDNGDGEVQLNERKYCPESSVPRWQMAKFLFRAFNLKPAQ